MKRAMLLMALAMTGSAVLAQEAPVAHTTALITPAGAHAATNETPPWVELRDLQSKIHPLQETLTKNDPEIKALLQQRKDAEQFLADLDEKRRTLIQNKLLADPTVGPLVKRRAELLARIQEMRTAGKTVPPASIEILNREGIPAPAPNPASAPARAP